MLVQLAQAAFAFEAALQCGMPVRLLRQLFGSVLQANDDEVDKVVVVNQPKHFSFGQ